tara:strand:- start:9268 stop:9888 length:621 start_codon:yes stop_codon:yes gene_type:complete
MNSIKNKVINLTKNILIGISLLIFVGCESTWEQLYDTFGSGYSSSDYPTFDLELRIDLPQDENGYYHLELDNENWQTIQRLEGRVISSKTDYESWERNDMESLKIHWRSNLYWVLGDTLGYIVKYDYTDDVEYVSYDTTYVTGFSGQEVPTINSASYPTIKDDGTGEINTMFAPVQTMVSDTAWVNVSFTDWHNNYKDKTFGIILK